MDTGHLSEQTPSNGTVDALDVDGQTHQAVEVAPIVVKPHHHLHKVTADEALWFLGGAGGGLGRLQHQKEPANRLCGHNWGRTARAEGHAEVGRVWALLWA